MTNLTLYSNNSNSSLARAGDLINITLEASEQIYNATLEILGTEINMTESNNTAYANISVLQNSPNGPVTFNITAYDGTGNKFNITQDAASANVHGQSYTLKSNHIQQQPQHITCNLGRYSKHHDYCKRESL